LMAWAMFGESLTVVMMTGVAVTVVGVALAVRPAAANLEERPT
jgi:drug/metabolite transporter (DMT)-like permease